MGKAEKLYTVLVTAIENEGAFLSDNIRKHLGSICEESEERDEEERAQDAAKTPTRQLYRVLVTRDTTETCAVVVRANNRRDADVRALAEADRNFASLQWERDDGNELNHPPYVGDPGNAQVVTEAGRFNVVSVSSGERLNAKPFPSLEAAQAWYTANNLHRPKRAYAIVAEEATEQDPMTYWKCPKCGKIKAVLATDLVEVGTPFCGLSGGCEETEMEPTDEREPVQEAGNDYCPTSPDHNHVADLKTMKLSQAAWTVDFTCQYCGRTGHVAVDSEVIHW